MRSAPALLRTDAERLASLSDRLAAETRDGCAYARDARRLRAETTRLINAHRIPLPLSEPLSSAVNDLAARGPLCVPAASARRSAGFRGSSRVHAGARKGPGKADA